MSRLILSAVMSLSLAGVALAQTSTSTSGTAPGNNGGTSTLCKRGTQPQPGMSATTSAPGNANTGASSATLGSGTPEEKNGVMGPAVPGCGANDAVGANPDAHTTQTP